MQVQGLYGIQTTVFIWKPDTGGSHKMDLRDGDNVLELRVQQQAEDRSCGSSVKIWSTELVEVTI